MFHSIRARIIAMTALVVVTSVCLTAIMVTLAVRQATRHEAERSLANDTAIYEKLLSFGSTNPSWDRVHNLVKELSSHYNRRIALRTKEGRLLVDSDQLLNLSSGPLRPHPEVVIDPFDPHINIPELSFLGDIEVPSPPASDADRKANTKHINEASTCLNKQQVTHDIISHNNDLQEIVITSELTDAAWEEASKCLTPLRNPLPSEQEIDSSYEQLLISCLQREGAISLASKANPLPLNTDKYLPNSTILAKCEEEVTRQQLAPPVELYLGSASTPTLTIAGLATSHTALIITGIAAIAGIAVWIASARIAHPLQALAAATQQLGEGDRMVRVTVLDRSEIGKLSQIFNNMADKIAHGEQVHRQMVADIAHELRNPLVTLKGSLEAIQDGIYSPTTEIINSLHEETTHLQQLVSDLQDLANADAGLQQLTHTPVNIQDPIYTVITAHTPVATRTGIKLVQTPGKETSVEGDETRLRQVLTNMINNAIAHTPSGGTITTNVSATADTVMISVTDTGEGIAPENLPFVFERFWRADKSRSRTTGRTGLGLAISEALIRAHGGKITVTSQLGKGTCFTIHLPAGKKPPED